MKYKIIASYHNSKFSRQIFVSFIYIFFCFTTSLKSQSDAEYWINFAEKSCIYEQNYTVDLHTELYQIPLGAKISIKSKSMNSTALIDKSTDALQYNKKDGLRKVQINKIAVNGSNSIKQNSFILDISSMLKKMKNKAQ
ncbi:MAG: hypothetical protein KAW56_15750, partial [Candidatus Marinimicrobia bacterium]|nr:hypothetical protein [Candidatus Neomarinimicrobiota bacterium]